jgi:O-antigen ligase
MTNIAPSIDVTRHWLAEKRLFWIRPLLVLGVLGMSALIPLSVSAERQMLLVYVLVGAAVSLIFMYNPPLGILALIANGLLIPSPSLPGGFNLAVLHLMFLIGLWLLEMLVRHGHLQLFPSRAVRPLLILLGVALLAFAVGQLPWFRAAQQAPIDAQIGGLMIFVLAVGAFLLVANQVRELHWLEWMTWVFILLGGLFVAGWIVNPIGAVTGRIYQIRATSNAIFWTWLAVMSFSMALYNDALRLRWRILAGGIFVMTMYVAFVLQYDWKSAWLPPLVAVAAAVIARWWRTGLLVTLVSYGPFQFITSQAIASDEYSYSTRLDAWVIILDMLKVNPILGFGPANYYWYTPLFRIRGYAVRFNSHNQYLDILAQTGILGLLCVLWFFIEVGLLGWRLRQLAPKGFARAYVYGALGGLAGTAASGMLVDWFLPFAYNIGLPGFRSSVLAWLFLGGLVSIEQIVHRQALAPAEQ